MVANAIPIVKTGKNPDSIKTRIETGVTYATATAVAVVRTLIPLKQG